MNEPETPNFEASLAELQRIVTDLETGSTGLEQSLADFERGVKLLRTCYRILEDAEQKIELLLGVNEQGEPVTEPFDATATYNEQEQTVGRRRATKKSLSPKTPEAPSSVENDDEGALF
jgi:exodeoxyribonuclease VII small subunit